MALLNQLQLFNTQLQLCPGGSDCPRALSPQQPRPRVPTCMTPAASCASTPLPGFMSASGAVSPSWYSRLTATSTSCQAVPPPPPPAAPAPPPPPDSAADSRPPTKR